MLVDSSLLFYWNKDILGKIWNSDLHHTFMIAIFGSPFTFAFSLHISHWVQIYVKSVWKKKGKKKEKKRRLHVGSLYWLKKSKKLKELKKLKKLKRLKNAWSAFYHPVKSMIIYWPPLWSISMDCPTDCWYTYEAFRKALIFPPFLSCSQFPLTSVELIVFKGESHYQAYPKSQFLGVIGTWSSQNSVYNSTPMTSQQMIWNDGEDVEGASNTNFQLLQISRFGLASFFIASRPFG